MIEERDEEQVPVLVAGAGPAGLTAAITLARQGIACEVVERRTSPSTMPRATALSVRTMELIRSWGLEDDIRAGGVEVRWEILQCRTLAEAGEGEAVPVGIPSDEQAAALSPTRAACVPQDHVERVLLAFLRRLPSARVSAGTEVVEVDPGRRGVRVVLRDVASGATRTVVAGTLVAADGTRSPIREAVGVGSVGTGRLVDAGSVLLRAPLWPVVGPHRHGLYVTTVPGGEGVLLPAGQDDRWVYGGTAEPGRLEQRTLDAYVERIRRAAGVPELPVRIEDARTFAYGTAVAERFRAGRVLLVGDAAHRVTPRGGTGLNAAVHGAHDAAWKLGWVLRGWAGTELLDSYEAERRPVVEHNAARSLQEDGSRRPHEGELSADLGGRIVHRWLPGSGRVSTIDLVGDGLTLLTAAAGFGGRDAGVLRPPVRVRGVDALTAQALAIPPGGGLLVRPDGVPVERVGAAGRPRELAQVPRPATVVA